MWWHLLGHNTVSINLLRREGPRMEPRGTPLYILISSLPTLRTRNCSQLYVLMFSHNYLSQFWHIPFHVVVFNSFLKSIQMTAAVTSLSRSYPPLSFHLFFPADDRTEFSITFIKYKTYLRQIFIIIRTIS